MVQAARREVREETGIDVEITGLSGIYSDPRHVIAYDNGEVRQEFSLCFHAKPISGELRSSSESREARWISPDSLQDLNIHPSMRLRINPCSEAGTAAIPRLVGQPPGQAAFCALDSRQQFRLPFGNEPCHDMAWPVPLLDLGDPIPAR